jgi:hypothetical protein
LGQEGRVTPLGNELRHEAKLQYAHEAGKEADEQGCAIAKHAEKSSLDEEPSFVCH